tara:strand:+ start:43 stop:450 length:408 start_codon:yes stop_codon:yes gene_type:complete
MYLTKIKEGYIHVPELPKEVKNMKRGLYTLIYTGHIFNNKPTPIKYGLFGEGVGSNAKSRFSSYRNMGKNIRPGNGSYKTMKILNEKLNIGEKVEVYFKEIPDNIIEKDGWNYKVDIYHYEKLYKQQHKDTLWLN